MENRHLECRTDALIKISISVNKHRVKSGQISLTIVSTGYLHYGDIKKFGFWKFVNQ